MKALSAAVVAVTLAVPTIGDAQEGVVEGSGYKVGEGTVLHPRLGLQTGYVSNVFYEEQAADPVDSGLLRLLAELTIATRPLERSDSAEGGAPTSHIKPKLAFRFGAHAQYEEYLSDSEAAKQQRNISGSLLGNLTLFPHGTFRLGLSEDFTRHTRPVNFEDTQTLHRNVNKLRATAGWHPPANTIQAVARYENVVDRFESEDSAFANRLQHIFGARVTWQFLPVTRLHLDASQGIYGPLGDGLLNGTPYKTSSLPLRFEAGLSSALTETTTLRLTGGWAAGFYETGPSFNSPIYSADFGLRYSPMGRFFIGFARVFQDSINANYFADWAFHAGVQHQVSRVLVLADAAVHLRTYEGLPPQIMSGVTSRDDTLFRGAAEVRYNYRDWLAIAGAFATTVDQTDFTYSIGGSGVDDPSYSRQEITLSVLAAL
jgi:hypothetical protein